jgi:hypothetical protein
MSTLNANPGTAVPGESKGVAVASPTRYVANGKIFAALGMTTTKD